MEQKRIKDTEILVGPQLEDAVIKFKTSIQRGMDAIKEAASIYVDALLRHPTLARARFYKECPTISKRAWELLEAIGYGDLNPAAFLLPNGTADKIRHLPIESQNSILGKAGEYKVVNPFTKKVEYVPIQRLTTTQAELLFDIEKGRVRSESEQRRLLELKQKNNRKRIASAESVPYRIIGNVVVINGVELGRRMLERILSEMSSSSSKGKC